MRYGPILCALLLCAAIPAMAQEKTPGIPVGAKAPAFELVDQDGEKRSLTDLLAPEKKIALVFYRSADW